MECLSEDDQRALLEEEIRQCDELLGMEPDCVRLSTHSLSCSIFSPPLVFGCADTLPLCFLVPSAVALLTKMRLCVLHNHGCPTPESQALLERLLVLDPAHTGYYKYLLAAQ